MPYQMCIRDRFSNEAGMGSAPNVAATAHVTHPVKQGLIQTLGVFTDTLIKMCIRDRPRGAL